MSAPCIPWDSVCPALRLPPSFASVSHPFDAYFNEVLETVNYSVLKDQNGPRVASYKNCAWAGMTLGDRDCPCRRRRLPAALLPAPACIQAEGCVCLQSCGVHSHSLCQHHCIARSAPPNAPWKQPAVLRPAFLRPGPFSLVQIRLFLGQRPLPREGDAARLSPAVRSRLRPPRSSQSCVFSNSSSF